MMGCLMGMRGSPGGAPGVCWGDPMGSPGDPFGVSPGFSQCVLCGDQGRIGFKRGGCCLDTVMCVTIQWQRQVYIKDRSNQLGGQRAGTYSHLEISSKLVKADRTGGGGLMALLMSTRGSPWAAPGVSWGDPMGSPGDPFGVSPGFSQCVLCGDQGRIGFKRGGSFLVTVMCGTLK